MIRKQLPSRLFLLAFFVISLAVMTGCTLTANYDPIIDQTVTALYGDVNTFLAKMERYAGTPSGEYKNNTDFYDKAIGTLDSMIVRAATIPKNENVTKQLNYLNDTIKKVRAHHESRGPQGMSKNFLEELKIQFIHEFKDILETQNILKRGKNK